ncbi:hypothetical protein KL86DYS1_31036 [uncultured Dysgonomonas sp.]|uniref:Uncharacterized protein n=1 Tax=uncultured Dysgonomonas sp. TaxID=206096 RepID=A0A212K0H8_9BACT|nr:hypothetical protein KL86DYS1_31036 [uncultured Dysgonomonas sp.]
MVIQSFSSTIIFYSVLDFIEKVCVSPSALNDNSFLDRLKYLISSLSSFLSEQLIIESKNMKEVKSKILFFMKLDILGAFIFYKENKKIG